MQLNETSVSRKVPTRFAPETRFEVFPAPAMPFRERHESAFEALKARLLEASLEELAAPELNSVVRRAANEATALARANPYPLLVYPVLFEERAATALLHAERQQEGQRRESLVLTT